MLNDIKNRIKIVIASTFTADPIKDTLEYFMEKFNIPSNIIFTPYNQVLQQLLDPNSLFSLNSNGINIILVRFEDCYRYASKTIGSNIKKELIQKNSRELITVIKNTVINSAIPYFICLCPPSQKDDLELCEIYMDVEKDFENSLSGLNNLHIIKHQEINRVYPVKDYYDEHTDKIAHIPYTEAYIASLGTVLSRKIYSFYFTPHKVIIVDCDNTLWKGICGESDIHDIEISDYYQEFQSFLEKKRAEGMLICVCSKNIEEDVFEVFDKHKGMLLKKDSIVSWYCNWEPKWKNIKDMSTMLGLGLDSMIFIDDNPLECAQVRANCPEVLTLLFPDSDYGIHRFLDHIWPFDSVKVTKEDKDRTQFYIQNAKREQFQNITLSYAEFLKGLNLVIEFEKASHDNLYRISQLTKRTNQFNFTTIRRNENEIEELFLNGDYECFVIRAKDRFGDYGMVGVIIFQIKLKEVIIDTFCLSCRALGRNIENKMISYIAEFALKHGVENISIPFIQSEKNKPAFDFLNSIILNRTKTKDGYYTFDLSVSHGIALKDKIVEKIISDEEAADSEVAACAESKVLEKSKINEFLEYITTNLYDINKIVEEVKSQKPNQILEDNSRIPPTTPIEIRLEKLWSEYLKLESIGVNDEFFALGGSSILLIRILSKVKQMYQVEIPLEIVFEGDFTISKLSKEIVYQKLRKLDINQIKQNFENIGTLSKEQIKDWLLDREAEEGDNTLWVV